MATPASAVHQVRIPAAGLCCCHGGISGLCGHGRLVALWRLSTASVRTCCAAMLPCRQSSSYFRCNSGMADPGARRTLAWFPENVSPRDVNVTITVTNVSVEFTKLGSFGTPLQFASNLVNSQVSVRATCSLTTDHTHSSCGRAFVSLFNSRRVHQIVGRSV